MGMRLPKDLERKVLAAGGVSESDARRGARPPAPARRLVVQVTAAVKTVSEANRMGRHRDRVARKSGLKAAVRAALPRMAEPFPLPAVVTLTRRSPGKLDDDNLRAALKAVRDEVARWVGVDDADPRIRFRYKQRPGYSAGLTIRVEHTGPQT